MNVLKYAWNILIAIQIVIFIFHVVKLLEIVFETETDSLW